MTTAQDTSPYFAPYIILQLTLYFGITRTPFVHSYDIVFIITVKITIFGV